jgi:hypothetical protein
MLLTIVNRWNDNVIVSGEFDDIKSLLNAFPEADLRYANLQNADLREADLTYADLNGADLTDTNLTYADLNGADLTGVKLTRANLNGADLTDADLTGADLNGANLNGANLNGANLDFASWPLWCGSLKAKTDDRLNAQLLYHVISVMGIDRFTDEQIKFANTFHRVGECPKLVR